MTVATETIGIGERLRAVADPTRWRITELLAGEELCVCHLTEELGVSQPLVSHHLRVLREAGLIESSRYRYWTYYRLRRTAMTSLGADLAALERDKKASRARRPCC